MRNNNVTDGWAKQYIISLLDGKTVKFRPLGNSMTPIIKSGQLVTVTPCKTEEIEIGSIALCIVKGSHYLHLVKNISSGDRFLIGNNKGGINGWIDRENIFGLLLSVED